MVLFLFFLDVEFLVQEVETDPDKDLVFCGAFSAVVSPNDSYSPQKTFTEQQENHIYVFKTMYVQYKYRNVSSICPEPFE